jgi:zinc transport system substrate-binding protein
MQGKRFYLIFGMVFLALLCISRGSSAGPLEGRAQKARVIVTSDTILSGMIVSLLPSQRYVVDAILPPGQCPGHYDIKLSDIEKTKKADLVIAFKGMPFMNKAGPGGKAQLFVDAEGRNWMAPDSYIHGLGLLAGILSRCFPDDRDAILGRRDDASREVRTEANLLLQRVSQAGLSGKPIIASALQKEPLEWMGLRVVGEYGRPEAMSAKEVVRLVRIGKEMQAIAVVDNLQSGPEAGKGIAETLQVPHVVLTNFPSESGYLATLGGNVNDLAAAMKR